MEGQPRAPRARFATTADVGAAAPVAASDVTDAEREAARAELRRRPPEQAERNRQTLEEHPAFGKRWHEIRRFFGITAFGVSANEGDAGQPLVIPHDESEHGQEELYLVVRGSARFEVGDETFEGGVGAMLYAPPGVLRAIRALEDDTLLFMFGGAPGTYEPPIWTKDWRPPDWWLARHRSG